MQVIHQGLKQTLKQMLKTVFLGVLLVPPSFGMLGGLEEFIEEEEKMLGQAPHQYEKEGQSLENRHEGHPHLLSQPFSEPIVPSFPAIVVSPPARGFEAFRGRVIPGEDARKQVLIADEWPFCAIGNLKFTMHGQQWSGTGCLVGPHHVLTAAHNLYSHDEKKPPTWDWAQAMAFIPGRRKAKDSPYQEAQGVRLLVPKRWVSEKRPGSSYDFGMVILDHPLGKQTGWFGLSAMNRQELLEKRFHIHGYPGKVTFSFKALCGRLGLQPDGEELWGNDVNQPCKIEKVQGRQLDYQMDTSVGQSGCPIWFDDREAAQTASACPYVVGVHTLGSSEPEEANSGVQITPRVGRTILRWIKKYQFKGCLSEWVTLCHLQEEALALQNQDERLPEDLSEKIKQHEALFEQKEKRCCYQNTASVCLKGVSAGIFSGLLLFQDKISFGLTKENRKWAGLFLGASVLGCGVVGFYYWIFEPIPHDSSVQEDQKSLLAIKRAAERGMPEAQYYLALYYYQGKGLQSSPGRAKEWARRAAQQQHHKAQELLKSLTRMSAPL